MTKATATKPQAAKSNHPLTIDRVRKAAVAISPNTSVRYSMLLDKGAYHSISIAVAYIESPTSHTADGAQPIATTPQLQ